MKKAALVKRSPETSPDWTLLIFVNLSTHHFAIILKTLVCLGHLTLRENKAAYFYLQFIPLSILEHCSIFTSICLALSPLSFVTDYSTTSPPLLTFSFCASPRTLSSSVMESTNPWKWWLHIFSISLSWFLMRTSSFSMKRPCSWPSYTDLEKATTKGEKDR